MPAAAPGPPPPAAPPPSAEAADFKAEYAKSNRSSCKKCKDKIEKDELRLARCVQSPHFDGKM